MYISVKNNFEASCYLTNPVSYDNSNYLKSFSYNLIDFFNDVTKINFPKFLSEMSENDFLTLFIGNLDGENIFSVNTKWILQTIEKNILQEIN